MVSDKRWIDVNSFLHLEKLFSNTVYSTVYDKVFTNCLYIEYGYNV